MTTTKAEQIALRAEDSSESQSLVAHCEAIATAPDDGEGRRIEDSRSQLGIENQSQQAVAWLYENPCDGKYVRDVRIAGDALYATGTKETPLYAHPAPRVDAQETERLRDLIAAAKSTAIWLRHETNNSGETTGATWGHIHSLERAIDAARAALSAEGGENLG